MSNINEVSALSHSKDPDTSLAAVPPKEVRDKLKRAIMEILRNSNDGLAAFEVVKIYFESSPSSAWPKYDSINKRMSELHMAGLIYDTGDRIFTQYGRAAVIWAVTPNS